MGQAESASIPIDGEWVTFELKRPCVLKLGQGIEDLPNDVKSDLWKQVKEELQKRGCNIDNFPQQKKTLQKLLDLTLKL